MSYLTLEESRSASHGIDFNQFPDEDVQLALDTATELIRSHTGIDWHYRVVHDETKRWRGDFSFSTNYRPRVLTSFEILTGTYSGQRRSFSINVSPVETTPDQSILPALMGDVALNRTIRGGQASSLLLATGAVPLVAFQQAWTIVTYTTGYDFGPDEHGVIQYPVDEETGVAQAGDGFTRPFPKWIKRATGLIAKDVMGEYQNAKRGMTGLLELRVADTMYRRPQVRPKIDFSINPLAKSILDRHYQVWAA